MDAGLPHWRRHPDEICVSLNVGDGLLRHAADQEGEMVDSFITKTRNKCVALRHENALKPHGSPERITAEVSALYRAATIKLGNADKQGGWALDQLPMESGRPPFRQRERAMLAFRRMKTLRKFALVLPMVTTTLLSNAISLAEPCTGNAAPPVEASSR